MLPAKDTNALLQALHRRDQELLDPIDAVFDRVRAAYPGKLPCSSGCSQCCVATFEITRLDLWRLWQGWNTLDSDLRASIVQNAQQTLTWFVDAFPFWCFPYDLRDLAEPSHARALEQLAQTVHLPCPVLGTAGECRLYTARPRICHLQGLRYEDPAGGARLEDFCAEVFGDAEYASIPPQPLDLYRQWELEAELRRATGDLLPRHPGSELPLLDGGYRTCVTGAILVMERWRENRGE